MGKGEGVTRNAECGVSGLSVGMGTMAGQAQYTGSGATGGAFSLVARVDGGWRNGNSAAGPTAASLLPAQRNSRHT